MSSVTKIDFATLGLRDALDLAILIEEESAERYEEFADELSHHDTKEAAAFFLQMKGNEEKHHASLVARRKQLFGVEPCRVRREQIFDVEAPETDEVRAFMSLRAALETSLLAERKACAFFEGALPRLEHPEVKALFTELAAEEAEHIMLVQRQLDKAPPDSGSDDAYADDPVEQD